MIKPQRLNPRWSALHVQNDLMGMPMNNVKTEASRKVVNAFYEAAYNGDPESAMALCDNNIAVHEPPYLPYGGTYRGLDGFRELGSRIAEYADSSTAEVEYIVAESERVFASIKARDRQGNNLRLVEQLIVNNGQITEITVYYFDPGSIVD
jgi:uncharacterized protein